MQHIYRMFLCFAAASLVVAKHWAYSRSFNDGSSTSRRIGRKISPGLQDRPLDGFSHWLHHIVAQDPDEGLLSQTFVNGSIPPHCTLDDLIDLLNIDPREPKQGPTLPPQISPRWPEQQAEFVFSHLPYPLDPRCTSDSSKW